MFEEIDIKSFKELNFKIWEDSLLLSAGNFTSRKYNSMTIGMGTLGYMWHIPVVIVGVRPSRFTHEFMERSDDFSICKFPPEFQGDLKILGSKSGRDFDKINYKGLTAIKGHRINSPVYEEAEIVFECSKIYHDSFRSELSAKTVKDFYKEREYHDFYIGEINGIYKKK